MADRKYAWEVEGVTRSYYDGQRMLTIEKEKGKYGGVHSQVLQDVLRRQQKAMNNFYRRVREGARKKGYPRFKGKGQYKSITYSQIRRSKELSKPVL